jgi:hypothetical protein
MIYNRTYSDIINAKKIFTEKIQKFIDLTADEQKIIEKAYFNLTAVNRITSKINVIWVFLETFGVEKVNNEDVREWREQEIFVVSNFSNIRNNIASIVRALTDLGFVDVVAFQTAYARLNDKYELVNLNNLEKLLFDIYEVFTDFAIQFNDTLYIFGAHRAVLSEGVLVIE